MVSPWSTNPALNDAANAVKDEVDEFSCESSALVIAELGFNGNIEKLYAIFPLGQETNIDEAIKLAAETHLNW